MKARDQNLDIYRGFTMVYIVGVIHVLYWLHLYNSVWKSYLLIEMPIVFYIVGASYKYSRPVGYIRYLLTRCSRMLLPYWVYCMISLLLIFIAGYFRPSWDLEHALSYTFSHWFNPFGHHPSNLPYLSWHLWFVPVYLLVIMFIPALSWFQKHSQLLLSLTPLLLFGGILLYGDFIQAFVGYNEFVVFTAFYLFWTYLGLYNQRSLSILSILSSKRSLVIIILCTALLGYLLSSKGLYSHDMQLNKFPPNAMFLVYSCGMFALVTLFKDVILRIGRLPVVNKLLLQYSKYSLTVFLYHPLAFLFIRYGFQQTELFRLMSQYHLLLAVSYFLFAIIVTYVLTLILGKIETWRFGK